MLEADGRAFLGQSQRLGVVEGAHGTTIVDRDGREILDFDGAGQPLGYSHPRLLAAMRRQIETLALCPTGYTNPPAIALAQRLVEVAPPGLNKVMLTASSEAAIGSALRLARAATGRHKVLAIGDAAARLGDISGVEHAPSFDWATAREGNDGYSRLADLIDTLLARGGAFAAVLAEPMAWATVTVPPPEFWQIVRESCDRTGTMLIFDESDSVVGRTGTMFHCEQAGAIPDLLVIGEGLGGGIVPLAAVIARDPRLQTEVRGDKNPVASAAALAMLETIVEDDLLERTHGLGHVGLNHLKEIVERHGVFSEARGIGLCLALQMAEDTGLAEHRTERVRYACLARGLNVAVGPRGVVRLAPPLTVSVPEIERALAILEAVARDC
jgi:4-aminobutyrate aminotransferase